MPNTGSRSLTSQITLKSQVLKFLSIINIIKKHYLIIPAKYPKKKTLSLQANEIQIEIRSFRYRGGFIVDAGSTATAWKEKALNLSCENLSLLTDKI
jgi:hypothetical protein